SSLRRRSDEWLAALSGAGASWRDGQFEAIEELVDGRHRVLVVQRTGWGKSLVYFVATRLLRDRGHGPTILISPLLSLMRNQVDMANRLGVRAVRVDSTNQAEWARVEGELAADDIDLLMVSPERLSNERFRTTTVPAIARGIGLFVVDEAHCISDWGHDFRPDYRRIAAFIRTLPAGVPLLATTATANARVIEDMQAQLGGDVATVAGPLGRDSLRLQNIRLRSQAERLAWLAEFLPVLPGHGVVYCSTTRDCDRVSRWLATRGIDAPSYHAGVEGREALEARLLANDVKALVATVALGMGFDKPDLGFVVHFQKPGSVVDYYQRIGRAGRAVADALVVLLSGDEDDEITDYFIRTAFPSVAETGQVIRAIEQEGGLTLRSLQKHVNYRQSRLEQVLKLLEVEGAVYRDGATYYLSGNVWTPDQERVERVTARRRHELERMRAFMTTRSCLMEFLTRELDDPASAPCGRCANCAGAFISDHASDDMTREAVAFLKRAYLAIDPRKQQSQGGRFPDGQRAEEGRALCYYGDAEWGSAVVRGKYAEGRFSDELVRAVADMVRTDWRPHPSPTWLTSVPSLRTPRLVAEFAERLAMALHIPFSAALVKVRDTPDQKTMENSAHQAANVKDAFDVVPERVMEGPVLLVDDMVDSRWTLTECARVLRLAGSGPVFPVVLANSSGKDDEN
ncbi:MAG TPA: RecQ family ATP-dependent DNA helicase, partial [Vicinamibacterales bacterium]